MTEDDYLSQGAYRIQPADPLRGTIRVPGDKSISHRAVMLGALAEGDTIINGFLESEDCVATLNAFRQMGIEHERTADGLVIHGQGLRGLRQPDGVLDMGNSGTGTRLLLGILAGQDFTATLTGDSSLRSRPMGRVTIPLAQMGASFDGGERGTKLPLTVRGGNLKGIGYQTPVASAQVKSAILLAGLFADGCTQVTEPGPSRDHTERMLETLGVKIDYGERTCTLEGGQTLHTGEVWVPGDLSSAAFFLVAASIVPGSDLTIERVGINPTRTGIIDVLNEMGANITLTNQRAFGAEPVADIRVRQTPLEGVRISGETVVRMIDEFPIFSVAAAFACTPSTVEGAEELRVKESDRIAVMVEQLKRFGADMTEREDGFEITGNAKLRGTECVSHGDHRIAMSLSVAGLAAHGETVVRGTAPVATSFPGFCDLLRDISGGKIQPVS